MSELCQKRLFVGKVPENATDNEISDIFSQFGVIDDIKRNPSRRYCFIEMSTVAEANAVVKYSGLLQLKGNILNVSLAKKRTDMPNHKGDEGQSQRARNQTSVHQQQQQQLQPQSSARTGEGVWIRWKGNIKFLPTVYPQLEKIKKLK